MEGNGMRLYVLLCFTIKNKEIFTLNQAKINLY